jgi:hypothetical protein
MTAGSLEEGALAILHTTNRTFELYFPIPSVLMEMGRW